MRNDWFWPHLNPDRALRHEKQIIFVGLDMRPIETARKGDERHTVIMAAVLLLIGFAGIVCLFLAHAYRSTRATLSKVKAFSELFGLLMSFVCYGIITWMMAVDTIEFFERGMGALSGDLGINWGYISVLFFIGCLAFVIVLFLQLVQAIGNMIRR